MESEHAEFKGHVGELAIDCPAIWLRFLNLFGSETANTLAAVYRFAAAHGALDDSPIQREPGVNFNTRPGRLCHILANELQESSAQVFRMAIIVCAESGAEPDQYGEIQAEELEAAADIRRMLAGVDQYDPADAAKERIYLAFKLDVLRHLHMSALSEAQRDEAFKQALLELVPQVKFEKNERLRVLIEAWCQRYARKNKS